MGVNIVCTLLLAGKYDWRISQVVKCKIKSCYAPCAVSITLSYLGTIYWFFEYPFLGEMNILICPFKKAVTWPCKIEADSLSYMGKGGKKAPPNYCLI